jgi:Beta-lactamase enzyme family
MRRYRAGGTIPEDRMSRQYRRAVALTAAVVASLTLGGTLTAATAPPARAQEITQPAGAQATAPALSPGELPPPGRHEPAAPLPRAEPPFDGHAACASAAHPRLAARMARGITSALRGRRLAVGLAVEDAALDLNCQLNQGIHFDAASAIKVTIISALLLKVGRFSRLTSDQRSLAWAMITRSDNDAATALWDEVGLAGMQRFLNVAHMSHTRLNDAWGLTELTAQDELTLLRLLTSPGKVLILPLRRYVLWLMSKVIPDQRWGVPAGAPADVTVHVKNGWLPYPTSSDWHVNSLGAFTGSHIDYQSVVLTANNPSFAAGIDAIEAAARVINRDLAEE